MISYEQNTQWQQIMWQPKINGRTYDVPINVLTNSEAADVHVYAGLGEERHATEAGVKILGELGIATAGVVLPFHILEPTRVNIERTTNEAPIAIAQQLNVQGHKSPDAKVNLIGKSQGGGVVLLTGRAAPDQYGAIGALAPVGLNRDFLGDNSDQQRRRFLRRLLVDNNLQRDQNPFIDKGNWRAGLEVGGRALSDALSGRLRTKVDYAMEHDFAADIAKLSLNHPLKVSVGEDDPLFRASELAATLGNVSRGDLLQLVPGSHASLLTRRGSAQLKAVGRWMSSVTENAISKTST